MSEGPETPDSKRAEAAVREALKSQYRSALVMLRQAVEMCPSEDWASGTHVNSAWQIAYHTLFFAHYYMQRNSENFEPWEHHQSENQNPDAIPGPPEEGNPLPWLPNPYTKEEVLDYCRVCEEMVDSAVETMDVLSPESGFHWYPIPKLEHQLVNIRHIQHGAAQIADRVRAATNSGIGWVGARPTSGKPE
ncbi:MAG: hypothetical protein ACYTFG_12665 [Planctomycetota bacterium]|jgi:hypothetical protein